jgi:uncharacterized membrane protein YbhN (UPF0104 family)
VRRLLQRATTVADRLLGRSAPRIPRRLEAGVDAFLAVHPPVPTWGVGAGAALANWVLDLLSLIAAAHAAVSGSLGVGTLLLAYAAGKAASTLPLLPAGLGTVDGALVGVLVARGVPADQALAAVLVYRGITVALLAVVGWVAAFVLHVEDLADQRRPSGGDVQGDGRGDVPRDVRSDVEGDIDAEASRPDGQDEPAVGGGDGAPVEEELPG